jgi:ribosomal protein L23
MNGAKICALKPEHNCNFRPDQSHVIRAHATNLKFLRQELPTFMTVTEKTTAKEISEAIFQRFGTRVSTKQCRHLKATPKRKRTHTIGTCSTCGGTGHNRLTCGREVEQPLTPSDG